MVHTAICAKVQSCYLIRGCESVRMENIMLEKVKEIVAGQLNMEVSAIGDNSILKEELGADSLDLFEIIMGLEEEFDIEIPTEDVENIKTITDVSNYLNEKLLRIN